MQHNTVEHADFSDSARAIRKVCMVDDIWLRASDRKAFGRLSAEKLFVSLLRHTTATTATTAALLQPRQRDSHAESARCQDLQFVTSPVSKWWLRAPASRAGGSAAARHSLSLQPPASASASADGLLGPWRRRRPAAPQRGHHGPQSMACQSAAAGNLGPVRSRSPSTNETNDTAFALNRQSATIGVAALNYFGWRNGGILNEQ